MKMTIGQLTQHIEETIKQVLGKDVNELRNENKSYMEQIAKAEQQIAVDRAKGKGENMGKFVAALVAGKGNLENSARIARDEWGNKALADKIYNAEQASQKNLNLTAYEDGGILAPYDYTQEIIELLRPRVIVRQLGAQVMPLVGGMMMPKQSSGSNYEWVGENTSTNASDVKLADVKMEEKWIKTVVPVSNKLVRVAGERATTLVTNDITQNFARGTDIAMIRGAGTQYTPKGLRHWAHADNVSAMTTDGGSVTLDTIDADLTGLIKALENADIPMIRPGWGFAPNVKWFLMTQRDGNGNYVYRDEMKDGMLWGLPFQYTTAIPQNLGSGGNESEIYFADFAQCVIGDGMNMIFKISTEASYKDANGNLVSAFDRDETVVRALAGMDFIARHPKAIAIKTGVTWGA